MAATELINSINAAADGAPLELEESERAELLAACDRLKGKLGNPFEATLRFVFAAHQAMALRVAIDMKLFDAAASSGDIAVEELATKTGADALLITRIIRILVGMGLFIEREQGTYAATQNAGAYVTGSPLKEAVIHISSYIPILAQLPEYFEKYGFKNPDDAFNGPFQYAIAFNVVMGISRMNRGEEWFEFYLVQEKLQVQAASKPLLVDVGGGLGHDLVALRKNHPSLHGKLIVQDLPVVINEAKDLPQGIEAMAHNFFTTQPVKGAKAYYLRTVLHDWPNKQAREILGNI
ncbi:hypothetical protein MMC25_005419 [Agyrium rufum]|nr:hypothetical protein [Agyrium rufum]